MSKHKPKANLSTVRKALSSKERSEHRWRSLLATFVISGLLASLLRAQIIPIEEAAILIYWPVGLIMAIFLAVGTVATERAEGTLEFLLTQPVSRNELLLAKWKNGLIQIVGMLSVATLAGQLAFYSRGIRMLPFEKIDAFSKFLDVLNPQATHPLRWLAAFAFVAILALLCCYSILFFVLLRARNEAEAALVGVLTMIGLHIWLSQIAISPDGKNPLFWIGLLNPVSVFMLINNPNLLHLVPIVCLIQTVIWLLIPFRYLRFYTAGHGKILEKWISL